MAALKIVQLSTYHTYGGAAIAALRLHDALLKSGVAASFLVHQKNHDENGVVALANNYLEKKIAFAHFAAERLAFLPFEKDPSVRFAFSPAQVGVNISTHPLLQEADVIHLNWINFGFLSLRSLEQILDLGKPVVWTHHDMWAFTGGCHYSRGCERYETHCQNCPYLKNPSATDLSFRLFERKLRLFRRSNLTLVSPSVWLGNIAQNSALTSHLPVEIIPYPIDSAFFKPVDKIEAQIKLGLSPRKKWILFGSMNTQDVRKGFVYFKEAIQSLTAHSDQLGVLIFGKSKPEIFDSLGLEVKALGALPANEVITAYQAANTLVVPSLEDNYPNTVLEAMACGTPVVGFRTGGIPEQIAHLQNGYVADLKSATDLATGIKFVLLEADYNALSQHARQVILARNSYETVARQYHKLYTSKHS